MEFEIVRVACQRVGIPGFKAKDVLKKSNIKAPSLQRSKHNSNLVC